jgi:hypothetical protein
MMKRACIGLAVVYGMFFVSYFENGLVTAWEQ